MSELVDPVRILIDACSDHPQACEKMDYKYDAEQEHWDSDNRRVNLDELLKLIFDPLAVFAKPEHLRHSDQPD